MSVHGKNQKCLCSSYFRVKHLISSMFLNLCSLRWIIDVVLNDGGWFERTVCTVLKAISNWNPTSTHTRRNPDLYWKNAKQIWSIHFSWWIRPDWECKLTFNHLQMQLGTARHPSHWVQHQMKIITKIRDKKSF